MCGLRLGLLGVSRSVERVRGVGGEVEGFGRTQGIPR
jgi:hypothetical protein